MTRETKVGLLVGLCIILLIGILVSDTLTQSGNAPDFTGDAPRAQERMVISGPDHDEHRAPANNLPFHNATEGREAAIPAPGGGDASPTHTPGMDRGIIASRDRTPGQSAVDLVTGYINESVELPSASRTESFTPTVGPDDLETTTVRGDTFTSIAQRRLGDASKAQLVADYNPNAEFIDGRLAPGQKLIVPGGRRYDLEQTASLNRGRSADGDVTRITREASRGIAPQNREVPPPASRGELPVAASRRTESHRVEAIGSDSARWVVVDEGQTLSELASIYLGSSARWDELLAENKDRLERPRDLKAGMRIRIPATGGATTTRYTEPEPTRTVERRVDRTKTYTVREGDTLMKIALSELGSKSRWEDLYKANESRIEGGPRNLRVGTVLTIPQD